MCASVLRVVLTLSATVCLITGLIVIASAGLPLRAAYTGYVAPDARIVAPEIGAYAPPFELADTEGQPVRLDDLHGSPVVINFWATWCEPCRVEMPVLQRLFEQHQQDGLRILAINLGEPAVVVRAWMGDMDLSFDAALDARGEVSGLYRLRGQPSTYVVSPEGIITHIFYGPVSAETLENALAPLLANQRQTRNG